VLLLLIIFDGWIRLDPHKFSSTVGYNFDSLYITTDIGIMNKL
jgi:hypothetical protein